MNPLQIVKVLLLLLVVEAFLGFAIMKVAHYCVFEDYSMGQCYSDVPEPWDAGIHNLF